jgi:hypothetical protein
MHLCRCVGPLSDHCSKGPAPPMRTRTIYCNWLSLCLISICK